MEFVYQSSPVRVVFGRGTISTIGEEVVKLGKRNVLILTTPFQLKDGQQVAELILATRSEKGHMRASIFSAAAMHTPIDVTVEAMKIIEHQNIDCLVALGGGSSIGLSKAIAHRTNLPQIAIPTTYAGSEATPILGQTIEKEKRTLKSDIVRPGVILYDVNLTSTLPKSMIVTSGINAIAHAIEALYSPDCNPIIRTLAIEGVKAMTAAIPILATSDNDKLRKQAQEQALYAAWLCGTCLGNVGMALHHKLCHTLGGTLDTPHAETHTIVLPHALQYNYTVLPVSIQQDLCRALEVTEDDQTGTVLAAKVYDLVKMSNGPTSLRAFGVKESDLDLVVQKAMATPYPNPAPLQEQRLRQLLQRAWSGQRPSAGL